MFEALAAPHRRRILDLLREQDQAVGDLVSVLGISQPGVSKHLRVLREAGLVEVRTDAQRRVYRLRTEPLREIDEWLAPYRAAWAGRLGDERVVGQVPDHHLGSLARRQQPGSVPWPATTGTARVGRDRLQS